jgi:hypothetical protein
MANLPAALCPVTSEPFSLSDGRVFGVPKTSPAFPPWSGAPLPYTFGGKAVLEYCVSSSWRVGPPGGS